MTAKFKVNGYVKHIETSEVYKVIEVTKGEYQFLYKLETEEKITIQTLYPESVLEEINN